MIYGFSIIAFGTVMSIECPRCGLVMTEIVSMGYRYMSCKCGEELETDIQRKWNDQKRSEEHTSELQSH